MGDQAEDSQGPRKPCGKEVEGLAPCGATLESARAARELGAEGTRAQPVLCYLRKLASPAGLSLPGTTDLEEVAITPLPEGVRELGQDAPAFEALSASAAGHLPFHVQSRSEPVI